MLRPAVAATNWARAGKTSGLDMGKRRLSVQRKSNPAVPGTIRCHKVPGSAEAVNGAGDEAAAAPAAERDFCPGPVATTDKTSSFLRISKAPCALYASGRAEKTRFAEHFIPDNWLVSHGYVTSRSTRRRRQQLFRLDFRGCNPLDADHDPAAGICHPHQYPADRVGDSAAQLSDAGAARGAAAAQHLSAAPDAAARARRQEIRQQRFVDGVAEALHDRA